MFFRIILNFFTLALFVCNISLVPCSCCAKLDTKEFNLDVSDWMIEQIFRDLKSLRGKSISLKLLDQYFKENSDDLLIVKFTITNNSVHSEYLFPPTEGNLYRMTHFVNALNFLCSVKGLPDMVFLLSLHDGLGSSYSLPMFAMAKRNDVENVVLLPDFDALQGAYQVLKNKDVVQYLPSWSRKRNQMVWRGSTAQRALDGETYWPTQDNYQNFSRVILCQLGLDHPEIIDAKFTFFSQGGETLPLLQRFKGSYIPFEQEYKYKYHILIDGNVCPYSNSCWKLFTNSLIFKADSQWIQWYYNALAPGFHYIPVHANLDDLLEKIKWAMDNDDKAFEIATKMRDFAVNNLTVMDNYSYLYHLLNEYSSLQFVRD